MKRCIFLSSFVICLLSAFPVWAQFSGGSGTSADPYLISSAGQLSGVGVYPSCYFRQIADIDLNINPFNQGQGWQPLTFSGYYDGANYQIVNLMINRPGAYENALFSGAQELQNINLSNVSISGGSVLAALCTTINSGIISNCTANGTITGAELGNGTAGGLLGIAFGSLNISNCVANITINNVAAGGGLVGRFASESAPSIVSNCTAGGSIRATIAGGISTLIRNSQISNCSTNCQLRYDEQAGGLFAIAWGSSISGCHATGSLLSNVQYDSGEDAGGLIGRAYGCQVDNCYATGSVESHLNAQSACGGLIGYLSSEGANGASIFVNHCYARGNVEGFTAGGLVGEISNTATSVVISNCFATGAVMDVGYGGGFVGDVKSWPPSTGLVSFINCYCNGNTTSAVGLNFQGGFGGSNYPGGENIYTDCFWDADNSECTTDLYNGDIPGITPKTSLEMIYPQSVITFATWDFTSIWSHDADFTHNSGYPYLETEAPGTVAAISFNPPAGAYQHAFYLTLTCPTEFAHIYYTMDGSEPSEASTEFSTQIVINHSCSVKARAYRQNWQPSEICTAVYSFPGATDDGLVPASGIVLTAYPNPFSGSLTLECNLPKASQADLQIYNLKGQLVKEQHWPLLGSGLQTLAWDGNCDNGDQAASGVYLCRLHMAEQDLVCRVLLLR